MEAQLLPVAKTDVLNGIKWFDDTRTGLGDEFLDEFYIALDRIKTNPEHFAVDHTGFRPCRIKRFTAVIYFRINKNTIFVTGVFTNGGDERQLQNRG